MWFEDSETRSANLLPSSWQAATAPARRLSVPARRAQAPAMAWCQESSCTRCYAYRYPDLLQAYCNDNVLQCDWAKIDGHRKTAGEAEKRKVACKNHDTKCYAYRNPDLFEALCDNDIEKCQWENLLNHYATTGRFEKRELECQTTTAVCYVNRNPDLLQTLCKGEVDTCEWPRVVEHHVNHAEKEGRPTGCEPPSPPPLPSSPPPPPGPPPSPPPPPPPPLQVVGLNGKPVTRTSDAPSQLSGTVIIITVGITAIATIIYCFCRIYAGPPQLARASLAARHLLTRPFCCTVMVSQQEVVTAADDLEGYGEQVQEWDDYDETEDRAFSSGKKKKKSKKKNKHMYGDFD